MARKTKDPYPNITEVQRKGALAMWRRDALDAALASLRDTTLTQQERAQEALTALIPAAAKIARHDAAGAR